MILRGVILRTKEVLNYGIEGVNIRNPPEVANAFNDFFFRDR